MTRAPSPSPPVARPAALRLSCVLLCALVPACGSGPDVVPGPKPPPPSTAPAAPPSATAAASAATPLPPERPPLVEVQHAALAGIVAAFAARDAKKVTAPYSDTVVSGSPGPLGWEEETGTAPIEASHARLFAAFPDMKWLSPRALLHGSVAIQEWVSNATHGGDLGGMKASGKPTGVRGISVYRFGEDGLIRRDSTYFDAATIARQTGAMPGKARPVPELPQGEMVIQVASGSPEEARRAGAARAMYAAFSGKDEKTFLATLSPDVRQKVYSQPDDQKGAKAAADGHRAMHKAFPDLAVTVTDLWAAGDRVIAEVTMTGTHRGALGPLKPTNRAVTLHSVDVLTFGEGDKITVIETYNSSLELLGQLGALPPPPKPAAAPKK